VWHFATKEVVHRLAGQSGLGRVATNLHRHGEHRIGGITIALATPRVESFRSFELPLAAWWPGDDRLLDLDSGHRPLLDALVAQPSRAPVWLTAFHVDVGAAVGVRDVRDLISEDPAVTPIVVSDGVQNLVSSHSGGMNLTNGVHDSYAAPFLADVRRMIRRGSATREAVAVAALRAGWWPEHVPAAEEAVARGRASVPFWSDSQAQPAGDRALSRDTSGFPSADPRLLPVRDRHSAVGYMPKPFLPSAAPMPPSAPITICRAMLLPGATGRQVTSPTP
jgi:hypothetical protein